MLITCFETPWLRSNMYLLSEDGHGILIDPYESDAMKAAVKDAVSAVDWLILTHEHFDHISGANSLREYYRCPILCGAVCAQRIQDATKNFSRYFNAYVSLQTGEAVPEELLPVGEYTTHADESFEGRRFLSWRGHGLEMTETPGHSPGSICILVDRRFLFSGDTLLPGEAPMTRFPDGSRLQFEAKALPYLRSLLPDIVVYPGHYGPFRLGDHPTIQP